MKPDTFLQRLQIAERELTWAAACVRKAMEQARTHGRVAFVDECVQHATEAVGRAKLESLILDGKEATP